MTCWPSGETEPGTGARELENVRNEIAARACKRTSRQATDRAASDRPRPRDRELGWTEPSLPNGATPAPPDRMKRSTSESKSNDPAVPTQSKQPGLLSSRRSENASAIRDDDPSPPGSRAHPT